MTNRYANDGFNDDALIQANYNELVDFAEDQELDPCEADLQSGAEFMADLESGHVRNMRKAVEDCYGE